MRLIDEIYRFIVTGFPYETCKTQLGILQGWKGKNPPNLGKWALHDTAAERLSKKKDSPWMGLFELLCYITDNKVIWDHKNYVQHNAKLFCPINLLQILADCKTLNLQLVFKQAMITLQEMAV